MSSFENKKKAGYAEALSRRAGPIVFTLLAVAAIATMSRRHVDAADPDFHIKELMTGANGDSRVQFLVIDQPGGSNSWGPQSGETESREMLVFFDAAGRETGVFKFPANPAAGGSLQTLIATQEFANLAGAPAPDVIIPPLLVPVTGKVCFKNNPANSSSAIRNECVSYGNFTGNTEINRSGNNSGVLAGSPAPSLPLLNTVSLRRTADTGHNSDFQLATIPTPMNIGGVSFTIPVANVIEQGRNLFNKETFLGNGRTCATCHQANDNLRLSPANIQSRFATLASPTFSFDPLFLGEFKPSAFDSGFDFNLNTLVLTAPVATPAPCTGELRGDVTAGNSSRGKILARVNSTTYLVYGGFNPMLTGTVTDGVCSATVNGVTAGDLAVPANATVPGLEDPRRMRVSASSTFPQGRGLILENIDGFSNSAVFRKSPHLLNLNRTGPFGLGGNIADLQSFISGAVTQHFPRTLARNSSGSNPDFRLPTPEEIAAIEAFLRGQEFPSGNDPNKYDLDRFTTTNAQRTGRAQFFGTPGSPNCATCHGGPLLSDTTLSLQGKPIGVNASFNTGASNLTVSGETLPCEPAGSCNSREFSVPPLFNLNNLGPFFHNASTATLSSAVSFYASTPFLNSPANSALSARGLSLNVGNLITSFLSGLTVRPYTLTEGPLRFGVQASSGGATASQSITVTNTGASAMTFPAQACLLTGTNATEFVITSCPITASLNPGESATVTVAFNPSTAGVKAAILEINAIPLPSGIDLFGVGDLLPPPPNLTGIVGTSGTAAGGDSLTLSGTNFASGAIVTIGGARAGFITIVNSTSITLRSAPHVPGSADVVVTNPDGQSAILSNGFTYTPSSTLSLISTAPASGSSFGSAITLTGTGFQSGATVTVGGKPATSVNVVTSTTISANAAPHAPGSVEICLSNPDGQQFCLQNAFTYISAGVPVISSVAPVSGSYLGGTDITILGSNFSGGSSATFGGAAATTIAATPTSLTVRTGAHAPGAVDVVVTNGDGETATRTNGFTYVPPVITSVSPNSGSTGGGTTVTINGSGFAAGMTVTFGGAAASISSFGTTSTSINAVTPQHVAGPVNIVVTNPDGQTGTIANAFTYILPTITFVSPTSGSTVGGPQVNINGNGFSPSATVTFGGTAATVLFAGSTSISVVTPPHAPGGVNVVVTNPDGASATRINGFTYLLPTISSLFPSSGGIAGGAQVAISGAGFAPGAAVTFGGAAGTVLSLGTGSISVSTPPHATGSVDVVVTNADGSSTTSVNGFTYVTTAITSITPSSGSTVGGTSVIINGSGFALPPTVTFGGLTATVVSSSDTSILVRTPSHAAGNVDVVVTNSSGSASSINGFTYVLPTITSVSPNSGGGGGGTSVTINGSSFAPGATVTFGGVPATNVSVSDSTTIFATAPPHAPGLVNVVVTNSDGSLATRLNAFTYVLPTISSVSPGSGSTAGGRSVTIEGSGFSPTSTVTFGGSTATSVSFSGSTTIFATTPPHAPGLVNVVVTNSDGSNTTRVNAFNYILPAITSIFPTSGGIAGGTQVTISGVGFGPAPTVTFGGLAAGVNSSGETSISLTTPAHSLGFVDVVVTNPDGSAVTGTNGFNYVPPTITSISPSSGLISGGLSVTITGSGFVPGSTVTFGGTAATNVFFSNDTRLFVTAPPHAAGAVSVVVTNTNGSATLVNGFTYLPPTISSISPTTGATNGGTVVNISGSGFSPGATITFGGVAGTNISMLSSQITARTPAHASGSVDVMVTNPDGSIAIRQNGFTYVPPSITTIFPTAGGSTAGGTNVSISGMGFLQGAKATFGGAAATNVSVQSDTQISAATPAHSAGNVDVVVTNLDGSSITKVNGFTYVLPTIVSISPSSGTTAGGRSVNINGSGFAPGVVVTFGGAAATITFSTETLIGVTTPAHALGNVNVVVTNPDGSSATSINGFAYVLPTITSISPATGSTGGETSVTINGSGFAPGLTVTFGGLTAAINNNFETGVTVRTPAHAAGSVNVVLTNPDGATSTSANSFTYILPAITSLSQTTGTTGGGTSLSISGSGFAQGAVVTFGGAAATNVSISDTSISATTPAHAAGNVDVVVTNPDGATATKVNGFQYVLPTITSITPSSGPSSGGTSVNISGGGFAQGVVVTFGGVAATNVFSFSGTSISATTPSHAEGAVNVVVTNPNGATVTSFNGFTYTPSITVSSVAPTSGTSLGGTPITISGSNFAQGATIRIGGVTVTNVVFVNSTTMSGVTGPHAAGLVNVVVTNPNDTTGTLTNGFTYDAAPAPQVTSITPTSGSSLGGTPITISGTNFAQGATVKTGGISATSVSFVNAGTLTATTGPHAAGSVFVDVTNPDGQSGTLPNGFQYLAAPPPAITAILPALGSTLGGTVVTVLGSGFGNGATVTIGGQQATNVIFVNSTTLVASTAARAAGLVDVAIVNPDSQGGTLPGAFTYTQTPSNDTFVNRFPIVGAGSITATGSNVAATSEPGEPVDINDVTGTPGVWWTWRATCSFTIASPASFINTTGSSFDTVLAVFTGSSLASLVPFAIDDDSGGNLTSQIPSASPGPASVNIVAGTVFQIRVRSFSNSTAGTIVLHINSPCGISGVSPSLGPTAGGTNVTITGSGFISGATVAFGGVSANNVTVVNSTTITATTGAHPPNFVDVTVTNTNGTSPTLSDGFLFTDGPRRGGRGQITSQ